jgi:hypothetical protein
VTLIAGATIGRLTRCRTTDARPLDIVVRGGTVSTAAAALSRRTSALQRPDRRDRGGLHHRAGKGSLPLSPRFGASSIDAPSSVETVRAGEEHRRHRPPIAVDRPVVVERRQPAVAKLGLKSAEVHKHAESRSCINIDRAQIGVADVDRPRSVRRSGRAA